MFEDDKKTTEGLDGVTGRCREVGESWTMRGLLGHIKGCGFYSEGHGEPWRVWEQRRA